MSRIEEFWAQHQGEDPLTMVKAAYAMRDDQPLVILYPVLTFKDVTVSENRSSYRRDPESVAGIPCDSDTVFDFVTVPSPINTVCKQSGDVYGDWEHFAVAYPETYNHADIETYLAWYDPAGFKEKDQPLSEKGQEEMVDNMYVPVNGIDEVPDDFIDNEYDSVEEGEPPMTDEEVVDNYNAIINDNADSADFDSTYTWIAGGHLTIDWPEDENFLRINVDLTKGTAQLDSFF